MANSLHKTKRSSSKGLKASLESRRSRSDRISNLPDALIHRILSLLSTKQAVATSVLSKRWVRLWTSVPTLDLEDSYRCRKDEQTKIKFVHFVDRVLLLNQNGSVEKFRLNCSAIYGHSRVNTWICSVIERGLQEVDISASKKAEEDLVKLPSGLFLLKTLKVLKLNGEFMVDVTGPVCFPNLKILQLLRVYYGNDECVRWLISGCTSLEELRIDARISQENRLNLNISTPTLNSLSMTLIDDNCHRSRQVKVEINTPALTYLNISCSEIFYLDLQCLVEKFPFLIEANISMVDYYRTPFVIALNSVRHLKLRGFFTLLGEARDSFPLFVNLTQLELLSAITWVELSLFIENSPKLETLLVQGTIFTNGGVGYRQPLPKLIPECFFSSLTRACLGNFEGLEDGLKIVEYFLENAKVLRTMEINTSDLSFDSKFYALKKLSMVPRSSKTCQLSFNGGRRY